MTQSETTNGINAGGGMLISCKDLRKQYLADNRPVLAADNINLDIAKNDFLTILGHAGSGKTTLLSLIGGLTTADKGKVLIRGKDVWSGSGTDISIMRNENIGFVFQFASLIPTLTVHENLLLPITFGGVRAGSSQRADSLLKELGIADKRDIFPPDLSDGQQRRVAIARAFINDPEIVLADEPTGDLDKSTGNEIMEFFYRRHQLGTTFVVVTHNSQLADGHQAQRVMNMRNGRLQEH